MKYQPDVPQAITHTANAELVKAQQRLSGMIYPIDTVMTLINENKAKKRTTIILPAGEVVRVSKTHRAIAELGCKCNECGAEGVQCIAEPVVTASGSPISHQVNIVTADDRRITRDHIVPVSKNGADNLNNIQILCSVCNGMKANTCDIPVVDVLNVVMTKTKILNRWHGDQITEVVKKYHNAFMAKWCDRVSRSYLPTEIEQLYMHGFVAACGRAPVWDDLTYHSFTPDQVSRL